MVGSGGGGGSERGQSAQHPSPQTAPAPCVEPDHFCGCTGVLYFNRGQQEPFCVGVKHPLQIPPRGAESFLRDQYALRKMQPGVVVQRMLCVGKTVYRDGRGEPATTPVPPFCVSGVELMHFSRGGNGRRGSGAPPGSENSCSDAADGLQSERGRVASRDGGDDVTLKALLPPDYRSQQQQAATSSGEASPPAVKAPAVAKSFRDFLASKVHDADALWFAKRFAARAALNAQLLGDACAELAEAAADCFRVD